MSFDPSTSRLAKLTTSLLETVSKLEEALHAQRFPSPSFDEDAPALFPKEAIGVRDMAIDYAAEIQDLLQGPLDIIYRHGSFNNCVSLQAISRFKIASLVPAGGQTTYANIAKETGLDERAVRRIIRHAITMRVFREPEPGIIAHTQASKALTNPIANDWVSCGTEEMWPASAKMVEALEKWPGSQEPNHTGFALANNGESIYQVLTGNPERAYRFSNNMKAYMLMQEYNVSHVITDYDWGSLGHVQLVDVGGGAGHVTMELAKHFPKISVVVQDMERMVEKEGSRIPIELAERFKYVVHDMFAPQAVQADVYYFRWVFHNWSDKYCSLIIKALIPALKPGARVILNEACMPDPGAIPYWREKYLRSFDLIMGAGFAAHERSIGEWKGLFAEADPRFTFQSVNQSEDSALAIIEFVWAAEK
ncbi:uncharacterized protein JN550_003407 [Neoarthrinium moseri]|uniref:uncharacterized protein n=1 Tax=Neoarthrinium moseri TaxID=1658444 RepID=UPI001FDAE197|nr:uncharacterized protein JN550_003407 [Neoarthrinium moseri]KAI1873154.1 hypothetical protein JN550_003407 [Neoarthrinium moseri]